MGVALTVVLAFHGAIHLLGYLKWSRLATIPALSGRVLVPLSAARERVFAAGWLAACCLLLAAATFRIARQDIWWVLGLVGILLSQCLILVAWPDAKAGTIANLVILVPAVIAAAHTSFGKHIDEEAATLLADAGADTRSVTHDDLRSLPLPVATWLETTGIIGRPRATTVRLQQRGQIRTKPAEPWMPARAEQYFSIDPPGFVWKVDASMKGLVPIAGRDKYVRGHGEMLIKAASLINVVNAADEAIDIGAMLRYLAEIIWFPSAALGPHVSWEPIDSTHARATLAYAGRSAPAVFTFDERGRALRFDADRPLGGGKDAKVTPWFGVNSEWRTFEGIEVPTRGEVGWHLPSGTFTYYRWEVDRVEFNVTTLFSTEAGSRTVRNKRELARQRP